MTFGHLFAKMHPDIKVKENGTCVWLYFDNVNHYTFGADWWNTEIKEQPETLKDQETVEPKQVGLYGKDDWYGLVCVCPDCKAEWMSDKEDTHFCPKCGREVKWDA